MISTATHKIFQTETRTRVHNSQIAGIGRLEHVLGLIVINNLGRNIQFCTPEISTKAVYSETIFPDLDDQSQFDLDMHAFVEIGGKIAAPNHHGLIRFFDPSTLKNSGDWARSCGSAFWPGDVERFISAHGLLLSSSPLGCSVATNAQKGLLISSVVDRHLHKQSSVDEPTELAYSIHLQSWGYTSALTIDEKERKLAVAAGERIGIFPYLLSKSGELQLLDSPVEYLSGFHTSALRFLNNGSLFAAGHASNKEDLNPLDWDGLGGGGWCLIGKDNKICRHAFGKDLAWGNGGDPVHYIQSTDRVIGIDRLGAVHCWSATSGDYRLLVEPVFETNRGIAHSTLIGDRLLCGFNRDGYNLHEYIL